MVALSALRCRTQSDVRLVSVRRSSRLIQPAGSTLQRIRPMKLPMSLRLPSRLRTLRPDRSGAAHAAIAVGGIAAALLTAELRLAMIATLLAGLGVHTMSQLRLRRRTESAERRFRTLVEELPAALYISSLDRTSQAVYVSPAIVDLLGYGLDEWTRNPQLFDEILHPLDREGVLAEVDESKRSGVPYEAEYRLFRSDGSIVWIRDRAVTVRDTQGRRLHRQGYLIDVTARKHAEARYRTLAEQLPLITYIDTPYSADEAAAYVSPQVEDILGYTLEEWHAD